MRVFLFTHIHLRRRDRQSADQTQKLSAQQVSYGKHDNQCMSVVCRQRYNIGKVVVRGLMLFAEKGDTFCLCCYGFKDE